MIFYAMLATSLNTNQCNQFFVRRDEAIACGRRVGALVGMTDVRVVKIDPKGHHQLCELLNIASGSIPVHTEVETVWRAVVKSNDTEELFQ